VKSVPFSCLSGGLVTLIRVMLPLQATAAWYERRRQYRDLLKKKLETFWQSTVDADRSSPWQFWRSIDQLMGRGHALASAAVRALELHQFFDKKLVGVRASTADVPEPTFSTVPSDCSFCTFFQLTADKVIYAVRLLPYKKFTSDPLPSTDVSR